MLLSTVEQYTRLTNLSFFNIEETEKWETAETSEDKVLAIIRDVEAHEVRGH